MSFAHITRLHDTLKIVGTAALITLLPFAIEADWRSDEGEIEGDDEQDIVINLSISPLSDLERACLAVNLGRLLKGQDKNVTLFPTLGGVDLASFLKLDDETLVCNRPDGLISLKANLEAFLDNCDGASGGCRENPDIVVCTSCWNKRFGVGAQPDYGTKERTAVREALINSEKIIDF